MIDKDDRVRSGFDRLEDQTFLNSTVGKRLDHNIACSETTMRVPPAQS